MKMIAKKYEFACFALMMSLVTSIVVSAVITFIHHPFEHFPVSSWFSSAMLAWPVVFMSILLIAPRLQRLVNLLVHDG